MKKAFSILMAVVLAVMLMACGAKKETASYRIEMEQSGMVITEVMTFEAENDKIVKLTDKLEIDLSAFDEATIEQVELVYDEMVEQYNSVEGAECTGGLSGSSKKLYG